MKDTIIKAAEISESVKDLAMRLQELSQDEFSYQLIQSAADDVNRSIETMLDLVE